MEAFIDMKKLILVTSPPACGKTFISKQVAKALHNCVYLDKDTLIVLSKQIFVVPDRSTIVHQTSSRRRLEITSITVYWILHLRHWITMIQYLSMLRSQRRSEMMSILITFVPSWLRRMQSSSLSG